MVRKGEVTEHGSIIVMDPPDHRHMRSLLNKVFTPRAIQSQQPMVSALIDKYLGAVDPDGFDLVQDFSALFPVEVITTCRVCPPRTVSGFGCGSTTCYTASPVRSRCPRPA